MIEEMEGGSAQRNERVPWSDRLITGTLLLFFGGLAGAAAFILFIDGRKWVILVALVAGALLWGLERLESSYTINTARTWNRSPGYIIPLALISLATLAVCLPTLNSYFTFDEFPYIRLFHNLSLSQFLLLFHSDLSQGILGWNPHELRPFYGLSYKLSYSIWGLHPLGYHLTAILLHIINSVLVFLLARHFAPRKSWRAAFAGLLFAVQPIDFWVISSANGSLTEAVPSLFYISAFLCFVFFRSTQLTRYFVMSVSAFAACLLSKETAVTLPIMLVSYDLFRIVAGKNAASFAEGQPRKQPWARLVLAYIPYLLLLMVYLELRRLAFTSYLREDEWGAHIQEATSSPAGFWLHLRHFGMHFVDLQIFNLRHLMLPFSAAQLGIVLGIYLVSAFVLISQRSECRRSVDVVVYFGFVWYAITNLPLLATYLDPHHLYLPAVGISIATAFVIVPAYTEFKRQSRYFIFLTAALLVGLCAFQLWKEDTQVAREAEITQTGTAQLAAALAEMRKPALVVIFSPHADESLPYSLEEPFQPADLYSRAHVIENPDLYSLTSDQWWAKTKSMLHDELEGAPDGQVEVRLFVWDERSNSFQTMTRTPPRGILRDYVTQSLGEPLEQTDSVGYDQGNKFVEQLAKLVSDGH